MNNPFYDTINDIYLRWREDIIYGTEDKTLFASNIYMYSKDLKLVFAKIKQCFDEIYIM